MRSITIGNYKYVATRQGELYSLTDDPGEVRDLLKSRREEWVVKVEALKDEMQRLLKRSSAVASMAEPDQNALATLGYHSYPAVVADSSLPQGEAPDPPEMTEVVALFVRAQSLLWRKEHEQAIEVFREIVKRDPENATSWALLGKLYVCQNELVEAEHAFRKFYYDLRPHLRIARNGLVDVLLQQKKYKEAEQVIVQTYLFWLDSIHQKDLDEGNISGYLRSEFQAKGRPLSPGTVLQIEEKGIRWAIEDKGQAFAIVKGGGRLHVFLLKIEEDDEMLLSLLACLKLECRDYAEAVHWARKATVSPHPVPGAYFYLGKALEEQEKFKEAIPAFEGALRIRPHWPNACYYCGRCFWESDSVVLATEMWDRLNRLSNEDPDVWFYRGRALHDQKKFREAAAAFQQAAMLQPHWPEVYYQWGLALWHNGDASLAREAWSNLETMPRQAIVVFYQGKAMQEQRRFVEAIPLFREAIALCHDWPEAYHCYGICHWEMGNVDSAIRIWQEILPGLSDEDPLKKEILGRLKR